MRRGGGGSLEEGFEGFLLVAVEGAGGFEGEAELVVGAAFVPVVHARRAERGAHQRHLHRGHAHNRALQRARQPGRLLLRPADAPDRLHHMTTGTRYVPDLAIIELGAVP